MPTIERTCWLNTVVDSKKFLSRLLAVMLYTGETYWRYRYRLKKSVSPSLLPVDLALQHIRATQLYSCMVSRTCWSQIILGIICQGLGLHRTVIYSSSYSCIRQPGGMHMEGVITVENLSIKSSTQSSTKIYHVATHMITIFIQIHLISQCK